MFTYRFTRLLVALSASGLLAIALMWGLLASGTRADAAGASAGVVRYVSSSGNDTGNDCLNSGAPCQSVQHAINFAQETDEIRVASGTYTGIMTSFIPAWNDNVTATVVITKNIGALLGGFNADFSLRDPDLNITKLSAIASPGDFVVFISGTTTLVNGFTITGSDGSNTGYGAGVRINGGTPKLQNNRILGNHAPLAGGGIYVTNNAAPIIAGNIIESNTAGEGAGIYIRSGAALITGNKIRSNAADTGGGGIYIRNAPVTIISNTIYLNQVISPTVGRGAGVRTSGEETLVTISHNDVFSNSLAGGGGSGLDIGTPAIVDSNNIHHNKVTDWGGALVIATHQQTVTVTNNVVADNAGGAAIWASNYDVAIINNSVARNTGDGITLYVQWTRPAAALVRVTNNILASNGECGLGAYAGGGTGLTLTTDFNNTWGNNDGAFCSLANPPSGSHNINADPQFVNPTQGDYHIHFGSPAMNTGTRTGAPVYDKDGVVRPQGSGVDMGAYEVNIPHAVYLPLTMKH